MLARTYDINVEGLLCADADAVDEDPETVPATDDDVPELDPPLRVDG